jgi:hypothetical protein
MCPLGAGRQISLPASAEGGARKRQFFNGEISRVNSLEYQPFRCSTASPRDRKRRQTALQYRRLHAPVQISPRSNTVSSHLVSPPSAVGPRPPGLTCWKTPGTMAFSACLFCARSAVLATEFLLLFWPAGGRILRGRPPGLFPRYHVIILTLAPEEPGDTRTGPCEKGSGPPPVASPRLLPLLLPATRGERPLRVSVAPTCKVLLPMHRTKSRTGCLKKSTSQVLTGTAMSNSLIGGLATARGLFGLQCEPELWTFAPVFHA